MEEDQNLTMRQGETRTIRIPVKGANGSAYNLSAADTTLTWKLYHPLKGTVLTKDSSEDGGITITNAAAGLIEIALVKIDTQSLAPLTYNHMVRYATTDTEEDIETGALTLKASRALDLEVVP